MYFRDLVDKTRKKLRKLQNGTAADARAVLADVKILVKRLEHTVEDHIHTHGHETTTHINAQVPLIPPMAETLSLLSGALPEPVVNTPVDSQLGADTPAHSPAESPAAPPVDPPAESAPIVAQPEVTTSMASSLDLIDIV